MIIGHLPAGYILSRHSYLRFEKFIKNYRTFMFWGIFGSIAPDFDMLYFYFIDHRQTHHHQYFSHYPILWGTFVVFFLCFCFFKASTREKFGSYSLIFFVAGFTHMILDSIVGDIWWFAPFYNRSFSLATVPSIYNPWWLNFVFHWSFILEICLVAYALWIFRRPSPNHSVQRPNRRLREKRCPIESPFHNLRG